MPAGTDKGVKCRRASPLVGCDRLGQLLGDVVDPGYRVEQRMSAGIAEMARIGLRVDDALPAHLEGQRQPTVDDDPQVAFDQGFELTADPSTSMTRLMMCSI